MSLRIAAYRCVPCVPCGPCVSLHTLQRFKSVAIPIGNTGEGLFLDVNYADTPLLSNPPSLLPSDFARLQQQCTTTPCAHPWCWLHIPAMQCIAAVSCCCCNFAVSPQILTNDSESECASQRANLNLRGEAIWSRQVYCLMSRRWSKCYESVSLTGGCSATALGA